MPQLPKPHLLHLLQPLPQLLLQLRSLQQTPPRSNLYLEQPAMRLIGAWRVFSL
jgi:hypothetical protein